MDSKKLGNNYNKIANKWNAQIMKNPEYGMNYVRKAMGFSKENSKVLDIGCGSDGRIIDEALKKSFEITALDVSSEMIRIAKTRHPNVNFINDDFIEWNTTERFDLIIAWDSIFHAPEALQKTLTQKMCSLLNSEGILLFTAGSSSGKAIGEMEGIAFEYGSIDYMDRLNIIKEMKCAIILMEQDQFPANHMVFICKKLSSPR